MAALRHTLRRLLNQPGFTTTALLTLALGIGANVALFSLLNAVLLRATPGVREADRLVAIYTSDFSGPPFGTSAYPDYEAIAGATDVFDDVAAYAQTIASVGDPAGPVRVGAELVTASYFDAPGVQLRGRSFTAAESAEGAPVAVISDALWRSAFGASPGAIGSDLLVNGRVATVIGVAGPGFRGVQRGFAVDLWVPLFSGASLGIGDDVAALRNRGNRSLELVARLRPDATADLARTRMRALASQLHASYPESWTDVRGEPRRLTVLTEREARVPPELRGVAFGFAGVLGAMVGLVLLICCANLAGLLLARVSSRSREIAIRLSIGATRGRIRALLLTESLLLAAGGAVLGLTASVWVMDLATRLIPRVSSTPIVLDLRADFRVLAFTMVVALVAAALFGTAPALRAARADLAAVLRGDAGAATIRGRRIPLRSLLVGGQVAASVVLLVAALLFLRSLRVASGADLGYATSDVLLVDVAPRPGFEPPVTERTATALAVAERLDALPFVEAATWAENPPVGPGSSQRRNTTIDGYAPARGEDMEFHFNVVGPRYFGTLALPLARGRDFTASDSDGAPGVIVVNETFARRFWPGEDPLGRRVSVSGAEGPWLTVVGVARDAKLVDVGEQSRPYMFLPALQLPRGTLLHVRTQGSAARHADAVRAAVSDAAPRWNVRATRTLEAQVAASVVPQRVAGLLLSGFGLLALLLASVGLYGVVAYTVTQRTRELGIRYALGATPRALLRATTGQAMRLVGGGLAVGLMAAWGAARLLRALLLGTSPEDPVAFLVAALLLGAVALGAVWAPARRVIRLDPIRALRME